MCFGDCFLVPEYAFALEFFVCIMVILKSSVSLLFADRTLKLGRKVEIINSENAV